MKESSGFPPTFRRTPFGALGRIRKHSARGPSSVLVVHPSTGKRAGWSVLGSHELDEQLALLVEDTQTVFSLDRLRLARSPIQVGACDLLTQRWPHRINQCLIKCRNDNELNFGPFESPALIAHVDRCISVADDIGLDWVSPYLYVTVDTAAVQPGQTQRVPGWHFDDLQGTDITVKQPGGFLFVAVSCIPTEFATHPFDPTGLDTSVHNVFDACGRQVRESEVSPLSDNVLAVLSAYNVHKAVAAQNATVPLERVFVRLLFSHCALTSGKTTLNPAITYDHVPHSTSGAIPSHLI